MDSEHFYLGIDVAQAQLDVAMRPTGQRWDVDNTQEGIGQLATESSP